MHERWRRPPQVLDIQQHPLELIQLPDGRVMRAVEITLALEDIERMRLGYLCGRCLEVFEIPWPEYCGACGVSVREKQAEFFAREFGGEAVLGSRVSIDEELASLPERAEREEQT
jgi:hypothetical protein